MNFYLYFYLFLFQPNSAGFLPLVTERILTNAILQLKVLQTRKCFPFGKVPGVVTVF
jgi:hypothetical protein